jgi:hypothetical protein
MVCPPATSEAEARWPRFGLVVVATNSRRDYLDQMIRPLVGEHLKIHSFDERSSVHYSGSSTCIEKKQL